MTIEKYINIPLITGSLTITMKNLQSLEKFFKRHKLDAEFHAFNFFQTPILLCRSTNSFQENYDSFCKTMTNYANAVIFINGFEDMTKNEQSKKT